jgi:predicted porin
VLYSNDGDDGNFYLVDNDNSSTRIGVLGTIHPSDKYEVGTRLEFEYQTNPSNLVNQEDKRVEDLGFEKRHLDLWVDSNSIGKFSLGWGSTASDGTSEMDLSGTGVIGYSSIADMAGGQLFFNKNTGALSDTPIIAVYSNLDGLGREERIRYDSPSFNGFVGSASYVAEGGGDLAVRYTAQMNAFKLAAAAAYANPGSSSIFIEDQLAGSVSVLHDSGFNGTFAMGTRDQKGAGVNDAGFFYTKFGYRGSWCPLGVTYLSADFGRFSDFDVNGDDADTVGLQMVQDLETWGSEAYLGYRFHKLDRNGVDFDTINAIMTGMRVKF